MKELAKSDLRFCNVWQKNDLKVREFHSLVFLDQNNEKHNLLSHPFLSETNILSKERLSNFQKLLEFASNN